MMYGNPCSCHGPYGCIRRRTFKRGWFRAPITVTVIECQTCRSRWVEGRNPRNDKWRRVMVKCGLTPIFSERGQPTMTKHEKLAGALRVVGLTHMAAKAAEGHYLAANADFPAGFLKLINDLSVEAGRRPERMEAILALRADVMNGDYAC